MTLKTEPYEFAQHVETEEDIREYLSAFLEEDGAQGFIENKTTTYGSGVIKGSTSV